MIPADMHARLSAALTVPVLLPAELHVPHEYAELDTDGMEKANARRGLRFYLQDAAPSGFVQIESPQGITAAAPTETYWVPVAILAPDAATCAQLADATLTALCGVPGRKPGRYTTVVPDQPRQVQPGVWMRRPTLEAGLLAGQLI